MNAQGRLSPAGTIDCLLSLELLQYQFYKVSGTTRSGFEPLPYGSGGAQATTTPSTLALLGQGKKFKIILILNRFD